MKNRTDLVRLLQYHIAPGKMTVANVTMEASILTLSGELLQVNLRSGGIVTINGANLTHLDIPASNGMVHIVDSVMIPPDVILVTTTTTVAPPSITEPVNTSAIVT